MVEGQSKKKFGNLFGSYYIAKMLFHHSSALESGKESQERHVGQTIVSYGAKRIFLRNSDGIVEKRPIFQKGSSKGSPKETNTRSKTKGQKLQKLRKRRKKKKKQIDGMKRVVFGII